MSKLEKLLGTLRISTSVDVGEKRQRGSHDDNLLVKKQQKQRLDVEIYVCNGLVFMLCDDINQDQILGEVLFKTFDKQKVFYDTVLRFYVLKFEDYNLFIDKQEIIINVTSCRVEKPSPFDDLEVYVTKDNIIIVCEDDSSSMFEEFFAELTIIPIVRGVDVFMMPITSIDFDTLRLVTCCESDFDLVAKKQIPSNIYKVLSIEIFGLKMVPRKVHKKTRTKFLCRILQQISLEFPSVKEFESLYEHYSNEKFYELLIPNPSLGTYRHEFNNWYHFRGFARYTRALGFHLHDVIATNQIGFFLPFHEDGNVILYTDKEKQEMSCYNVWQRSFIQSTRYLYVDTRFESMLVQYEKDPGSHKKRKVFVPFDIADGSVGHSNSLVIDLNEKSIYRYEPNGFINSIDIDNELRSFFFEVIPSFTYYSPRAYQDDIGPQSAERKQTLFPQVRSRFGSKERILETKGFCAAWTTLFMFSIALFPEKTIPVIVKTFVSFEPNELSCLIRLFQSYVMTLLKRLDGNTILMSYTNHRERIIKRLINLIQSTKEQIENHVGNKHQLFELRQRLFKLEEKKDDFVNDSLHKLFDESTIPYNDDDIVWNHDIELERITI